MKNNALGPSLIALMLVSGSAFAIEPERLADAIYKAEGGTKAVKPFGILSVPCEGYAECRQICLNTITNHLKRHASHECGLDYITCLGRRYCPPTAHKLNHNWVRNVKAIYNGQS